jgi:hypothetical protein
MTGITKQTRHVFRPRLLAQIVERLAKGQPVLLLGGPKMGKSYLLERLQDADPTITVQDDCSPQSVGESIEHGTATCMAVGVGDYHRLMSYRRQCFWVPLANLTPKMMRSGLANDHVSWESTAGHPYLSDYQNQRGDTLHDPCFRDRCTALLSERAQEKQILDMLLGMPTALDPAERYQSLSAAQIPQLKSRLDWLVCAGFITRLIHGDRPGVLVSPIW